MRCCAFEIIRSSLIASVLCSAFFLIGPGVSTARGQDSFNSKVDQAIKRGRKSLTGRFRSLLLSPPNDYRMGRIALPLTALLKAGISTKDPLVIKAFDILDRMQPSKTYGVACYLFALDAYWQQGLKQAKKSTGPTFVRGSRQAKGKVLEKMVELINWLINARVHGQGVWSYSGSRSGYDYSNSQFAILGLEVGVENGIKVPREVFHEIAEHFMRSQRLDGPTGEVKITFNPPAEAAFTKTYVVKEKRFSGKPGGWAYKANNDKPYASMTAAGTSNLLVVRHALRKMNALSNSMNTRLSSAIHTAMAWMTHRFDDYISGRRWPYYTMYSLEKVGDLGDVLLFGTHDWYREGALELIRRQKSDGSWGDYVDTSFAILFLTRATRLHLRSLPPPTIFTVSGKDKAKNQTGDLVYIDVLEAFISAREFFIYLKESRRSNLIPIAEQVVNNYALDRQEELIPYLLGLWDKRSGPLVSFVKRALAEITGVKNRNQEFYQQWHQQYLEIDAFLKGLKRGVGDLERVGQLLASAAGVRLKEKLLNLIERENLFIMTGHLADELLVVDQEYRQRVHGILVRFTGQNIPLEDTRKKSVREEEASRWRSWWEANSARVKMEYQMQQWVNAINRDDTQSASPDRRLDRKRLVQSLVDKGKEAVPFILDGMTPRGYRIELIVALEKITGERLGFTADPWRRWWRESPR